MSCVYGDGSFFYQLLYGQMAVGGIMKKGTALQWGEQGKDLESDLYCG